MQPDHRLAKNTRLVVRAAPEFLPVRLEHVREHLKIDGTHDDTLLQSISSAAVDMVEQYCGRSIAIRGLSLFADDLGEKTDLPMGPVAAIEGVYACDANGIFSPIDSDLYYQDGDSVIFTNVASLPLPVRATSSFEIRYQAGEGGNMPHALIMAILMLCAYMYEHRGEEPASQNMMEASGASVLCTPYKKISLR